MRFKTGDKMANIVGADGMTDAEIIAEVEKGGRFVYYIWCVSILVMTFKRSSDVYFLRAGESAVKKGLSYTFLTLFAGWWGIPWGPIYSLQCLGTNLSGGKDVTDHFVQRRAPEPTPPVPQPVDMSREKAGIR